MISRPAFDAVRNDCLDARTDNRIAEVRAALEKLKAPPRVFPEVTAWEDSFLHLAFRWKLLCLVADSAAGILGKWAVRGEIRLSVSGEERRTTDRCDQNKQPLR